MFDPINAPPTEHHTLSTGQSTEFGDSAKVAMEKINAGFKHVYGVLKGMGATLADEVEYVAKTEFDAVVHELSEVQAELANVKMMVQGLGFAGARVTSSAITATVDGKPLEPGAVIPADTELKVTVTGPPSTHGTTGMTWDGLTGSAPVVTVKEVPES